MRLSTDRLHTLAHALGVTPGVLLREADTPDISDEPIDGSPRGARIVAEWDGRDAAASYGGVIDPTPPGRPMRAMRVMADAPPFLRNDFLLGEIAGDAARPTPGALVFGAKASGEQAFGVVDEAGAALLRVDDRTPVKLDALAWFVIVDRVLREAARLRPPS